MSVFKYYTKIYENCNCFIVEFDPSVIRFDVSIGKENKLEKLSTMTGNPKDGEFVLAKLNGGFFNMDGSAEYIGTFVDDGKTYNEMEHFYPTAIFWKNLQMTVEFDADKSRLDVYKKDANWALGCPWSIIVDGKYDYHYIKNELINAFSHPFTKQPRSMMGQKADGTIVWIAVDGRSTSSVGMTLDTCGKLMLELGCVTGLNLDGGGSTELICYDGIKNAVSSERYIGTALFAYLDITKNIYGVVNTTSLNIRSGNGTSYTSIGSISSGTEVKIIGYKSGWYQIQYNDIIGYCSASYITLTRSGTGEISLDELSNLGYNAIEL